MIRTVIYPIVLSFFCLSISAQNVMNGSVNGNVGNSQFNTVLDWDHCIDNEGFSNSADVCDIGFPCYNGQTTVAPITSPDGGTWVGIANDDNGAFEDECVVGYMENLTIGTCYELFFYGANFGAGVGNYADGDSVILSVTIDNNITYIGIKSTALTWFEYRIPFVATAAIHSFRLHNTILNNEGRGYCGLDGFDVNEVMVEDFVDLGVDTILCVGETLILDPEVNGDHEWQNGSMNTSFEVDQAGLYWVEVEGPCGIDRDSIVITYDGTALEFSLGADTLLCDGAELELFVALVNVEFEWQDGSTDSSFIAQGAGIYWVEVSDQCSSFRDSIVLGEDSGPSQALGNDTTLCPGGTLLLSSNLANVDFEWQDGSMNTSFEIDQEGLYWLEVSNFCGSTRDSIIVAYEESLELNLGTDQELCEGDILELNVPLADVEFEWQDGSIDSLIEVVQNGIYWVEVTSRCEVVRDSIEIALIEELEVELGEDQLLCGEESVVLEIDAMGGAVLWHDGSNNSEIEISETGLVWVSLQNSCFEVRDSIFVTSSDVPTVDLGEDLLLCHDEVHVLDAQFLGAAYLWQDGSDEFSFLVQDSGKVSVILSNACGEARDSILVDKYRCGCDYYIPNVFSPNIDGLNDEFMTFSNCPVEYYKLSVINRWGALVFQSTNPDGRWFGYFKGDLAQNGVYSYYLEYQFEGEEKKLVSGDVTLLR